MNTRDSGGSAASLFLLPYLKRQHQQGIAPEISEILQTIMTLLKNGIGP